MSELSEQEKMDQLIAQLTSGGDPPVDEPGDDTNASGTIDQSAIDSLLAGGTSEAPETEETEIERFDQKALDRLLGASLAEKEPSGPKVFGPATSGDNDEKLLDQSELDDLFSSLYEEKSPAADAQDSDDASGGADVADGAADAAAEAVDEQEEDDSGDAAPEENDTAVAEPPEESQAPEPAPSEAAAALSTHPETGVAAPPPSGDPEPAQSVSEPADESRPETQQPPAAAAKPAPPEPVAPEPVASELAPSVSLRGPAARRVDSRLALYRSRGLVVAILAAVGVFGLFGVWRYAHRPGKAPAVASAPATPAPAPAPAVAPQPQPQPQAPAQAAATGIDALIEQIERLRDAYRVKHEEIEALQAQYRREIAGVEDEIRAEAKGVHEFKQAVENKRIELGLKTIQRQQAYIDKLEESARHLQIGNEELRFLQREIQADARIAAFTENVTVDHLAAKADEALKRYGLALEKARVDLSSISLTPLEQIWKSIAEIPAASGPAAAPPSMAAAATRDAKILDQICQGHFENKHRLTDLTVEAAGCLAAWKGKDLFLNGLSRLSPESAARLAQWKGQWICLNGLTEVSEPLAAALAQWPGRRLSLNGVATLPAAATRQLARWPGRELELVGLQALSPEAAENLSPWKAAGGKVIVSPNFRWPQAITQ